jgi:hypothetical protein
LLALVSDGIRFNGFQAFRLKDVSKIEVPCQNAGFVETALDLRNEVKPSAPPVSVNSLAELIRSSDAAFPLVTIHREIADPEVCHIGIVEDVNTSRVLLHEIGPDAEWDEEATAYRRADITRVDFGGDYEEALWLVSEARWGTGESAEDDAAADLTVESSPELDELIKGVTQDNLHAEIDFGPSQEKEL